MHITQVIDVPHFRISGTAGRIALKFDAWLETPLSRRFYKSLRWGSSARTHMQMCSFCISESAEQMNLKFGVWLVTHQLVFFCKS